MAQQHYSTYVGQVDSSLVAICQPTIYDIQDARILTNKWQRKARCPDTNYIRILRQWDISPLDTQPEPYQEVTTIATSLAISSSWKATFNRPRRASSIISPTAQLRVLAPLSSAATRTYLSGRKYSGTSTYVITVVAIVPFVIDATCRFLSTSVSKEAHEISLLSIGPNVFAAVAISRFKGNGSLLVRQARFPTTQDPFLHSNSR